MQKQIFFIFLSLLILTLHLSCEKGKDPNFDEAGVITKLTPKWKRSLHEEGTFYSNSHIRENLVYNGNPIIPTTIGDGDGDKFINLIDLETGEDIWKWNDIYEGFSGKIDIFHSYISGNFLWYQQGSRSYTINLDDGTTQRKERYFGSFDQELSGIGNLVFLRGPSIDTLKDFDVQIGHTAHLKEGLLTPILLPNLSMNFIGPGNLIGGFSDLSPIVSNSDTFLVAIYAEPLPNWYIDSYLGLYNFSKKEWVYDRISLATPTQSSALQHPPIIYEDKIYMNLSNHIMCHDLFTGEKIWDEAFPRDFLFSGFIVEDGKVIANCEDKILYGLDAQTGIELWQGAGSGTSSTLRYANGIVYFSGGSTPYIHAVDTDSGKTVWKLEPSLLEPGAERFKSAIYLCEKADGEKPQIVVTTFRNAYCFDAYR